MPRVTHPLPVRLDDIKPRRHYMIHRYLALHEPAPEPMYSAFGTSSTEAPLNHAAIQKALSSPHFDVNKVLGIFSLAPLYWPFQVLSLSHPLAIVRLVPRAPLPSPFETVLDLSRTVLIRTNPVFIRAFLAMKLPQDNQCPEPSSPIYQSSLLMGPPHDPPAPAAISIPSPTQ